MDYDCVFAVTAYIYARYCRYNIYVCEIDPLSLCIRMFFQSTEMLNDFRVDWLLYWIESVHEITACSVVFKDTVFPAMEHKPNTWRGVVCFPASMLNSRYCVLHTELFNQIVRLCIHARCPSISQNNFVKLQFYFVGLSPFHQFAFW